MTPTMEEVAGWLREDAEHFRLIGEGSIEGRALCAYAAQSDSRAAQVEAMGWRPIEEAPKDGSCVLVFPPTWMNNGVSAARWNDDKHAANPRPYWARTDTFGRVLLNREKPPTHFMFAPQPPVNK